MEQENYDCIRRVTAPPCRQNDYTKNIRIKRRYAAPYALRLAAMNELKEKQERLPWRKKVSFEVQNNSDEKNNTLAGNRQIIVNQSLGTYAGVSVALLTLLRYSPWASLRIGPFPFQIQPSRIHQLTQASTSVDTSLSSSTESCLSMWPRSWITLVSWQSTQDTRFFVEEFNLIIFFFLSYSNTSLVTSPAAHSS